MLEAFQRRLGHVLPQAAIASEDVQFMLGLSAERAFVSSTDRDGNSLHAEDVAGGGPVRQLLERMDEILAQQSLVITWGGTSATEQRIYLDRYPDLLLLLKQCPHVLDEAGKPLTFADTVETVTLRLTCNQKKDTFTAHVTLTQTAHSITACLSERFVLAGSELYEVLPLGSRYSNLKDFETTFPKTFLNQCLSLFVSHFDNIHIDYADYRVQTGENIHARPVLFIDEIGQNKYLHMRLGITAGALDADWFERYDVTKICQLYEEEKLISIHTLAVKMAADTHAWLRETIARQQKAAHLKNSYNEDETGIALAPELAHLFLKQELGEVLRRFSVLEAKRLAAYHIHTPQPRLLASLNEGLNYLEGSATLEVAGQTFNVHELLRLYKKHAYIPLSNGDTAILNPDYVRKLTRLFQTEKNGTSVTVSFFDLPIIDELLVDAAQKQWRRYRKVFAGFNTIEQQPLKLPALGVQLRDYQIYGIKWLQYLCANNLHGCLADDMGLGKTIQAIGLLSLIYVESAASTVAPSLIVMPKSLLFNWERELHRVNPKLSVQTYYGSDRVLDEAMQHQVILTTYQTMRRDIERLRTVPFDTVILDESGHIKNPESQVSKAAALLQANHRFALSGTPIENNLGELFALFRFLEPAFFRSQSEFLADYLYPIQRDGNLAAADELRRKIYPFILRRTKQQVLKSLPRKVEQILYVDLSPQHAALYEARRKYYYETVRQQLQVEGVNKSQFVIFQALNELRQLVSCPEERTDGLVVSQKRESLREKLAEAFANGHKVLVFTQYLQALENVAEDVDAIGAGFVTVSGSTTNREQAVNRFESDPDCRAFIATLKTGGYGLNLTAADTVFIYDPWWNKAAEDQAIDRSHRMGQKNAVFAYRLIARGTIEEKILQLQQRKSHLADQLISTDTSVMKTLNEADVNFLLQ